MYAFDIVAIRVGPGVEFFNYPGCDSDWTIHQCVT